MKEENNHRQGYCKMQNKITEFVKHQNKDDWICTQCGYITSGSKLKLELPKIDYLNSIFPEGY